MSPLKISRLVRFAVALCFISTCCATAVAAPINLTSSASTSLETSHGTVTLRGTVTSDSPVASVHWVNQFEQRGLGSWSGTAQGASAWSASNIALRHGVNLITVTVVDTANRSASLHFVVNNKSAVQAPSLPVGTGYYQNRPVVYQLWKGRAVVEGDMIVSLSAPAKPDTSKAALSSKIVSPDGIAINYTSNLWPTVGGVHQVPYIITGLVPRP